MLIATLVLALLVPARLHALVASQTLPTRAIETPITGDFTVRDSIPHDFAPAAHHGHASHAPKPPSPTAPHEPQNSHAQCLTACLVIPVPLATIQLPPQQFSETTRLPAVEWLDGLAPPRLERPPRALS